MVQEQPGSPTKNPTLSTASDTLPSAGPRYKEQPFQFVRQKEGDRSCTCTPAVAVAAGDLVGQQTNPHLGVMGGAAAV